jgi:hypothetical protein
VTAIAFPAVTAIAFPAAPAIAFPAVTAIAFPAAPADGGGPDGAPSREEWRFTVTPRR